MTRLSPEEELIQGPKVTLARETRASSDIVRRNPEALEHSNRTPTTGTTASRFGWTTCSTRPTLTTAEAGSSTWPS
jgi:hypothetical protein